MAGPIDIHWFSGTGNTLLVVRRMAEAFRGAGVTVALRRMELADPADVRLPDGDGMLGLAFPVAEFSTFPLVWEFVEKLPPGNGAKVFMVATMGGGSGLLVGPMKGLLLQKGYTPVAARQIVMPTNFLMPWCKPFERCGAKIERGLRKADRYAEDLLAGRARWRRWSPIPYPWIRGWSQRAGKSMNKGAWAFHADPQRCTRCGLCTRLCPVHNIALAAGAGQGDARPGFAQTLRRGEPVPEFGARCQQCQRCVAFCPARAIVSGHPRLAHGMYRAVSASELLTAE